MLRISVSRLDLFNKYLNWDCWRCDGDGFIEKEIYQDGEKTPEEVECPICDGTGDYYSQEKLIEMLTTKVVPTKFMEYGTGFHDCIEKLSDRFHQDNEGNKCFVSKNGIRFKFETIETACQLYDYSFPFEVSIEKIFELDGESVKITGRVDQLFAHIVIDTKTTYKPFNYFDYKDSIQWQLYLNILGLELFRYNVFPLKESQGIIELNGEPEIINLHISEGMTEKELNEFINLFVKFIHKNKLEEYFNESH